MTTREVFVSWKDRLTALWVAQKIGVPRAHTEPTLVKLSMDLIHASDYSKGKDPVVDATIHATITILQTKYN